MQLAALMHGKSQQAKPENRKKLAELAEAHRHIAHVRAEKAKPAEPESPAADDGPTRRAVGPRGMEYSVPNDLPYKLLDDPDPFDTVENLERRLAELQAMPDYVLKDMDVDMLERIIATKKRIRAEAKTQE
jgi:hypothetical protein